MVCSAFATDSPQLTGFEGSGQQKSAAGSVDTIKGRILLGNFWAVWCRTLSRRVVQVNLPDLRC